MNGHLPYLGVWVVSVICLQLMQSRSTASLSPGLTTATAYWRVCRFASWNGFNQSSILLHVFLYGGIPSDHVTDLLRDILHWLRVLQRITYKLCLITYKVIHNRMPTGCDHHGKIYYKSRGLPRSLATVPSLSQDPLRGTASQIM